MTVSAIVSTYNEAQHIEECLRTLFAQRGIGDLEVIVVDGGSEDGTAELVRKFPGYGQRLQLLNNPKRLAVYAWNLGCRAARGEYVAFINAHTTYDAQHLRACIDIIERGEADAAGPVQLATGTGALGGAIAWAMSAPFGVGNARYRFTDRQEEADSVFSMVLRRTTLERIGDFDERIPFDEDSEFAYRLRASGGRIVVTPAVTARYHARDSLPALARQMFRYGYWRRFTRRIHRKRVPARVYAPPALVAALAVSAIVPLCYAGFVTLAMLQVLRRGAGVRCALCIGAVLPCMHLAYGAGFLSALLKRPPSSHFEAPRTDDRTAER